MQPFAFFFIQPCDRVCARSKASAEHEHVAAEPCCSMYCILSSCLRNPVYPLPNLVGWSQRWPQHFSFELRTVRIFSSAGHAVWGYGWQRKWFDRVRFDIMHRVIKPYFQLNVTKRRLSTTNQPKMNFDKPKTITNAR